jgi:cytochrome b
MRHLSHAFRREPDWQVGHNAAGGWMVIVLIVLLLGETLTGLYINNDVADSGPLTPWVPAWLANAITDWHTYIWDALVAAVALHLMAIALYAAAKGQNLLRPMVTGRKVMPTTVREPKVASAVLAVLLLVVAGAVAVLAAAYL